MYGITEDQHQPQRRSSERTSALELAEQTQAEEADDSMEEEGYECEVCGRVFDDEDEAEAHEASCKVKQEEIVELHRRNNKEKHGGEKMPLGGVKQQREGEMSVADTGLVGCSCLMSILHHIIKRPNTTVLCLRRCVLCFRPHH